MKPLQEKCRVDSSCSVLRDRFPSPPPTRLASRAVALAKAGHFPLGRTLAFSMLLLVFATSFAFAQRQKIKSEFDNEDWWAQKAAIFFPKYEFTLAATNLLSLTQAKVNMTTPGTGSPNATLATIEWANIGSDWATGGNWVGGTAPASSATTDVAAFGSTGGSPVNPNLAANRAIAGISFLSGAFSYTIGGAGILTIGSTGISNSATNTETISLNLRARFSQTWTTDSGGTLVLSGTVDLNGNDATGHTVTIAGAGDTTINGVVQNSFAGSTGNLTKNGTGTLILAGNNTYNGATTLNGGTTLINGNQSSATGAVSVNNSGTTLGGTGTIGGTVTLGNTTPGAILNPGPKGANATPASVGTLTTGALTLTGANTFHVDAFGTATTAWDKLVSTGAIALGTMSTLDVAIATGLNFTNGTVYTLLSGTSLTGTFSGIADGDMVTFNGYDFTADYTATGFDLVAVPEPSTWIAGALALGVVGWSVVRKKLKPETLIHLRHNYGAIGKLTFRG